MSTDRSGKPGWVNKALAIRSGAGTALEEVGDPVNSGSGVFLYRELLPSYGLKEQCGNNSPVLPVVVCCCC